MIEGVDGRSDDPAAGAAGAGSAGGPAGGPGGDPLGELIAAIDGELAAAGAGTGPAPGPVPAEPAGRRHLLFSLGGTRYAVRLDHLVELGLPPPTTPVPNAPEWLRGVANLRGDIVAVVDLAGFFGLEPAPGSPAPAAGLAAAGAAARLLVVRAGRDEVTAGLLVDGVHGLVGLGEPGSPTAEVADRVAPFLAGVSEHQDRLVAVLDLERFFASPEVRRFEPV